MGTSDLIIVTVLDTTEPTAAPSDTGPTQTMKTGFLKHDIPARLSISLGSGDTVVVEGKAEAADSFVALHTWTGGDEVPVDVYLSKIWRCRRTVDGGGADSTVKIENRFNELLDVDE